MIYFFHGELNPHMLGYAVPITMAKSTHIHARNSQEMQLQVAYPSMG